MNQIQLNFTPSSLTQIMKFVMPLFVIKKDYIYTSIYLDSMDKMFYLMNKFTIEYEGLLAEGEGNMLSKGENSTGSGMTRHNLVHYSHHP